MSEGGGIGSGRIGRLLGRGKWKHETKTYNTHVHHGGSTRDYTQRMHTYADAEHIKFQGEGGGASISLAPPPTRARPSKNKKRRAYINKEVGDAAI